MDEENEMAKDPELEGYEDLFEDSPEDKAKALEPVETSIPYTEIKRFTSPTYANRHAVKIYLQWHYRFLPGLENEGYRRREADAMEQVLKERLKNWGLFNREESFRGKECDDEGQQRVVEEKFRVWVVEEPIQGPGN